MKYKKLKKIVFIPSIINVKFDNGYYYFKGPKGQIKHTLHDHLSVKLMTNKLYILCDKQMERKKESSQIKSLINTTYALFKNYIYGISNLFNKTLILKGIGYKADYNIKSSFLTLSLGFSHFVKISIPKDIFIEISNSVNIFIKGVSKYRVGQISSNIRSKRTPENYKGNGIRYADEFLKLKSPKKTK